MNNLAIELIRFMGGEDNIISLTHCATRLRPVFVDKGKVDTTEIENLDEVVGLVNDKNGLQIVIGSKVNSVYKAIMKVSNLSGGLQQSDVQGKTDEHKKDESTSKFNQFLDIVVSIFRPLLPIFAGSGLLRGFTILAVEVGLLSADSTTNIILTAAGTAVFYFLPLLVAITTAKRFKASPYIAIVIMGTLMMPNFLDLMGTEAGNIVSFFGLPVPIFNYTGQVIPAIFAVWIQSIFEHYLEEKLPDSLTMIVIPTVLILIMVPIVSVVIGPIGNYLSIGIANVVEYVVGLNSILAGAIIGGIWNILIMFGIHWAPNTVVIIPQIALTGQSALIAYGATANFGMAGAAFAIYLKTRDRKRKNFALTSITSVFLSGIVEPAIYGLGIPLKTPLIAGCIGAALGGAFMGLFNVVGYAFVFGGLTTIPAFAGPTLWAYIVGNLIAFVGGMVITLVLGWKEDENE